MSKFKQNTELINSINNQNLIVKGEFLLKKHIQKREDIGFLFKNVYLNKKFLTENLWIYKSEMTKELIDNMRLTKGEIYYIEGIVSNLKWFTKDGSINKFAFGVVKNIDKNLKLPDKKKRKRNKNKNRILKCPNCNSLNIQKVKGEWCFCEICFNEFKNII